MSDWWVKGADFYAELDPVVPPNKGIPMKQVWVMSGLPGSGKSSFARVAAEAHQRDLNISSQIVSADDFFCSTGEYLYTGDDAAAHRDCWRRFFKLIQDGCQIIIVDNTNLTAAEIAPYILPAEANGYTVKVIRVGCDPELAFSRQKHGVPRESFDKMVTSWKKRDVMPWWRVDEIV